MEVNNQNLSPQLFPPIPTPKKWFEHKGLIAMVVLVILAASSLAVYFIVNQPQNLGPVVVNHHQVNQLLNSTNQAAPVSLAKCKNEQYNSPQQGDCFRQYGMTSKDMNACKTIGVYPNDVDCAIGVAVALNDRNLCDQVTGFTSFEAPQYGVEGCRVGFAVAMKNCEVFPFSQAGNIAYKPDRDRCYSGVAESTLDDSYCAKISSVYDEDVCYQDLGQMKNDTTICDKMVDFNLKDEFKGDCYTKIAQTTKNSSICDKITFMSGDIATCYELLNLKPPANASVVTNPNAAAILSQQPSGGYSVSFTLDSLEATTTTGQFVEFKGKITNNSEQDLYINGVALTLPYSELTGDSNSFFQLPPKLKPGESESGEMFTVAVSQVALPGDYYVSASIQGGKDKSASDMFGNQTAVIHVTK